MEIAELELVPIAAATQAATAVPTPSTAVAVVTVKAAALALFTQTEKDLLTLAERYDNVAFDTGTPKGLKEAKEARQALREGRYAVQRIEEKTKCELNDLKKTLKEHAEKLVAIVKPTEDTVHQQIEAREAEIEAEREREAARKQLHLDNIAVIAGYAAHAQGKDAAALAKGIERVEAIDVTADSFQEYATQAAATRFQTLEALRGLHAKALEDERVRAENERRQRVIATLGRIAGHVAECVGKHAAFIQERVDLLADTIYSEEVGTEVLTAHESALAQLRLLHTAAQQQEATAMELAALKAAHAAPAPMSVGQFVREVFGENDPVTHALVHGAPVAEPEKPKRVITVELDDTLPAEIPPPAPLPTLKLGAIALRLGFVLTAEFISSLGFDPAGRDGAARLYHESDWPRICDALVQHISARKVA